MLKLKKNMSNFDRLVRFIVSLLLLSLFFIGEIRGVFGIMLIVVSVMFAFASITAFCPFYKSVNFNTNNRDDYI
ncbi:DUF2892 domain-containing protein [Algibacter sp. L4_22]|uniref:YgaP family membrane protein n=1 Tax=unclassified Algibacter TaxID=2615009 RepID=UPI00131E1191|nr:DUF2892 domain-containing protein [Algibacter sp. L4_22]